MIVGLNIIGVVSIVIITAFFILTLFYVVTVKNQYKNLLADIQNDTNRRLKKFNHTINHSIVQNYIKECDQDKSKIDKVEMIRVNQNLYMGEVSIKERRILPLSILIIIIGIFGSVLSYYYSLTNLVSFLSQTGLEIVGDVDSITGELMGSISEMSLASIPFVFAIIAVVIIQIVICFLGTNELKKVYLAEHSLLINEL